MKIDDKLNLVLPLRADGETVESYVYHTPISKEVFERNYKPLAAVKSELAGKNIQYQMSTGPQIAALALKDEYRNNAVASGKVDDDGNPDESEMRAFFSELARLSMILVPTTAGWENMPVDAAIRGGHVDEDEWSEVESAIVFFTSHFWLTKKASRKKMADASASLLSGFVTSLPISECQSFLPKLMQNETSQKAASSVPV